MNRECSARTWLERIDRVLAQCDEADYQRECDELLKQCDEMSATVREGSKLLAEAREGLSKKLREMSVTHEFVQTGQLTKAVKHDGGTGAVANRKPPINHTEAGLAQSSSSPAQIAEAERKLHCTAHRLTQEADERWPEEEDEC